MLLTFSVSAQLSRPALELYVGPWWPARLWIVAAAVSDVTVPCIMKHARRLDCVFL